MQYINHSFLLGSFRTFLFLTALLTPYVIGLMVDMRNSLPFGEFFFRILLIFDLGDVEMEIDDMSSDNTKTACSAASKSKENHVSL